MVMDEARYNEIKRRVQAFKAQNVLDEDTKTTEPKGKTFESVDALIAYISRKD